MDYTIEEWFKSIKDLEVRNKAISNLFKFNKDPVAKGKRKTGSLKGAINAAFTWTSTPEGHRYWSGKSLDAVRGNLESTLTHGRETEPESNLLLLL